MAKELEVTIPDIGDYHDVPVIEVLVKAGDAVAKDASLVTLESDKSTLDVPAPAEGTVKSVGIKVGDRVSKGSAVLVLEVAGSGDAPAKAAPAEGGSKPAPAGQKKLDLATEPPESPKAPPAASPAAAGKKAVAAAAIAVSVPDIGDYHDVPVIEVLVKDGDEVAKDATLLTLESDKSTLEVPAPQAGVVQGLKIRVGDKVSKGTAICTIAGPGEGPAAEESSPGADSEPDAPAAAPKRASAPAGEAPAQGNLGAATQPPPASPLPGPAPTGGDVPYASPSIRKFARELGVDLARVAGSGTKGRITQEDVQGFVKKSLAAPPAGAAPGSGIPPVPAVDFAQFGPVESKPLARIRKLSKTHLHRAWLNIPHVTQTDEADITDLEAFRKAAGDEAAREGGAKLTLLPFVLKAVARAIDAFPEFASSLDPTGENLVMKQYRHIGFAADTPNGLVVPVIRDVDRKGIQQLAQEAGELAKKARDGKLKAEEMKGGVFSVSSLGGIGGSHFTPIVNAPEVGILGVSRGVMKPVWDGKSFQPRLMLPLSLSYDHRVIDGAYGARFIVHLSRLLGDLRRLAL